MPRAKRTYFPGMLWHLTQRCHDRAFLLRFEEDRRNWLNWMLEAKQRYELSILNYTVTSNHVHLVVLDDGPPGSIAEAMHLASGQTAQDYNLRKKRRGAFWDDRYHATAVDTDIHFLRCLFYIDLNMVRAGVVGHPRDWRDCGFREIVGLRERYRLIDRQKLCSILHVAERDLERSYARWMEDYMQKPRLERESCWTESVAVGSECFVNRVKKELGLRATYRKITGGDGSFRLEEEPRRWRYPMRKAKRLKSNSGPRNGF